MILGMRPEPLVLGSEISDSGFDAGVELIERLGAEILIEARAGRRASPRPASTRTHGPE